MRTATAHALDDGIERDVKFQHIVELDAGGLHRVGLRNGARKSIEQKTLRAVRLGNSLFDQINNEVVDHQAAGVHDFFGFDAQRRTSLDRSPKHVAGGNLRNAVFLADEGRLGPLARAWRAQQNQSHGCPRIIMNSVGQA